MCYVLSSFCNQPSWWTNSQLPFCRKEKATKKQTFLKLKPFLKRCPFFLETDADGSKSIPSLKNSKNVRVFCSDIHFFCSDIQFFNFRNVRDDYLFCGLFLHLFDLSFCVFEIVLTLFTTSFLSFAFFLPFTGGLKLIRKTVSLLWNFVPFSPLCWLFIFFLKALTTLYNSTNGQRWFKKTNWLTGDPCNDSWFGVTCDWGGFDIQQL